METVGFACSLGVITGVKVLGYPMKGQRCSGGRWGLGYIVQRGRTALVCLLGFGDIIMGQASSEATWDPVKTTCNMDLARGVVVGNKMYVDGGEIMDQQNYLFGIDQPYYESNMIRWQSELPSDLCPILFHLTEPNYLIYR